MIVSEVYMGGLPSYSSPVSSNRCTNAPTFLYRTRQLKNVYTGTHTDPAKSNTNTNNISDKSIEW